MEEQVRVEEENAAFLAYIRSADLDDLYEAAISSGINVTNGQVAGAIQTRREEAAANVRAQERPTVRLGGRQFDLPYAWVDRAVQWLDNTLLTLSGILVALATVAWTRIGLPSLQFGLFYAEFVATWAGFVAFDDRAAAEEVTSVQAMVYDAAPILAFVAVMAYFVFSYQIAEAFYIGAVKQEKNKWSLRLLLQGVA